MLKKVIGSIFVSGLVITAACNVMATDIMCQITFENGNTAFSASHSQSTVDNSDLNVKVVKRSELTETVVYKGCLDGYDNGAWINVDFEETPYFMICDWWGENPGIYYIIPAGVSSSATGDTQRAFVLNGENAASSAYLKAETALIYGGTYHESILKPECTLSVPVSVTNTSDTTKTVVLYIAKYDTNGGLSDLIRVQP